MNEIVDSQDIIVYGVFTDNAATLQLPLRFNPTHVEVISAVMANSAEDSMLAAITAPWVDGGTLVIISSPMGYDTTGTVNISQPHPQPGGKFMVLGNIQYTKAKIERIDIVNSGSTETNAGYALTLRFTREIPSEAF